MWYGVCVLTLQYMQLYHFPWWPVSADAVKMNSGHVWTEMCFQLPHWLQPQNVFQYKTTIPKVYNNESTAVQHQNTINIIQRIIYYRTVAFDCMRLYISKAGSASLINNLIPPSTNCFWNENKVCTQWSNNRSPNLSSLTLVSFNI